MAKRSRALSGGCRCGAIRYRTSGRPLWVVHCHCESCRRATGAAFATYAGFRNDRFRITRGKPKRFASSPGVARSFCGRCGSPLAFEGRRWPDEIHILVASFDNPESTRPRAHVHFGEHLKWLDLDDRLPRFRTTSKAGPPMK